MSRFRKLWVIVGVALAIRLWFLAAYALPRTPHALGTIPFLFEPGNIAASIASGNGYANPFRVETGPTAWAPPVYPLLLAGVFRICGLYTVQAFLLAAMLNVLFSALTCIPLFLAGRRMFGVGVAAAAAWLWAIFPNATLLAYESMFEGSLSALLAAMILSTALWASDSSSARSWTVHGLVWGVGLMTNASFILLFPVVFGWAALRGKGQPLLAPAVMVLCCVPWTVRNYQVFGEFVPLRSVGGLAIWLGNNEQGASISPDRLHPISNQQERDHYAAVGEMEYMREKQALAMEYIPKHLGQVAGLTWERFIAFWSGGSPHPLDDALQARRLRFFLVVPLNLLTALGSFAGLWILARERSSYFIPLAAFVLVFPLVYYVALAHARYKHPIDPLLLLLTAFALSRLTKYRETPSRHLPTST